MAASRQEILQYLTDIKYAQSAYMDDIILKERLGGNNIFADKVKTTILNNYVNIMVDYFEQADYTTSNFFTIVEIQNIIDRINIICDSNYIIKL